MDWACLTRSQGYIWLHCQRLCFYADRYIDKLIERVDQLESNPKSGRVVPEFGILTLRELIECNYRIVYQINSSQSISIIRVHHSAREQSRAPATNKVLHASRTLTGNFGFFILIFYCKSAWWKHSRLRHLATLLVPQTACAFEKFSFLWCDRKSADRY